MILIHGNTKTVQWLVSNYREGVLNLSMHFSLVIKMEVALPFFLELRYQMATTEQGNL
jgi:hypothetical protein